MTIRRVPTDFRVDEVLAPELLRALADAPGPAQPVALYRLTKTSLSTPEATAAFAKALSLRPGRVEYAGLKDKHAVTLQHVSILADGQEHAAALPATLAADGPAQSWSAKRLGWIPRTVSAKDIERNRFEIVVRDLSPQAAKDIARRADLLRDAAAPADNGAASLLILNYFGDQRFGSARHGEGFAGAALIKGDFESALRLAVGTPARKDTKIRRNFTRALAQGWGDWARLAAELPRSADRRAIEHLAKNPTDFRGAFTLLPPLTQQMCVEAFQSHLWNDTARRLAVRIADEHLARVGPSPVLPTPERPRVSAKDAAGLTPPLLRTPDPFGEMLFPHAAAVDAAWRTVDVPLMAKSTQPQEPWAAAAGEALAEAGVAMTDLRIPGLRRPYFGEVRRRLFVPATDVAISPVEDDDLTKGRHKRSIRFDLPRGSYATVVLRALGQ